MHPCIDLEATSKVENIKIENMRPKRYFRVCVFAFIINPLFKVVTFGVYVQIEKQLP